MCFDAMLDDDEEVDETEEKLEEAIEWAMSTPGMKYNPDGSATSALEELELEEFADHLREEGVRVGKETLEDIKTELLHPYCDDRGDCGARGPLESDRLFELLTSETEATLRPGCLVYVRYIRFEAGRQMGGSYQAGVMHVALQSGLTGTLQPPLGHVAHASSPPCCTRGTRPASPPPAAHVEHALPHLGPHCHVAQVRSPRIRSATSGIESQASRPPATTAAR